MLTSLKQIASQSKLVLVIYMIYQNWRAKRRFKSGNIAGSSGAVETEVSDSLDYINRTFSDYLKYSNLSVHDLSDKTVLEIGPGDNLGVALKFLAAGAKQVFCIDKYLSKCDSQYESQIYKALGDTSNDFEKHHLDDTIDLDSGRIKMNSEKLHYICGMGIEEGEEFVPRNSVDLIVSRATLQHLYDLDRAFSVMDNILKHGGCMIHKIDFRDLGMFSSYGFNPLTFLTIPNYVYGLMTYDSGRPNRKLLKYYTQKMKELRYDSKFLITHIVGCETEIFPYKDSIKFGIDYFDATISYVSEIRPYLADEFKTMTDHDLIVTGIFLTARKP